MCNKFCQVRQGVLCINIYMSFAFYYSTPTIKYLDPFTEKNTFARSLKICFIQY